MFVGTVSAEGIKQITIRAAIRFLVNIVIASEYLKAAGNIASPPGRWKLFLR